jgi:hypothetical protein
MDADFNSDTYYIQASTGAAIISELKYGSRILRLSHRPSQAIIPSDWGRCPVSSTGRKLH